MRKPFLTKLWLKEVPHIFLLCFLTFSDGRKSSRRKLDFASDGSMRKSKSVTSKIGTSPKPIRKSESVSGLKSRTLSESQKSRTLSESKKKSRTLSESVPKDPELDPLNPSNLLKRHSVRRDSKLKSLVLSRKFQTFYQIKKAKEEMLGFGMGNQPIFDQIPGKFWISIYICIGFCFET